MGALVPVPSLREALIVVFVWALHHCDAFSSLLVLCALVPASCVWPQLCSMRTTVILQFNPEAIACAAIHLAAHKLGVSFPDQWWRMFGAQLWQVEEIGVAILELYRQPKAAYVDLVSSASLPDSERFAVSACMHCV